MCWQIMCALRLQLRAACVYESRRSWGKYLGASSNPHRDNFTKLISTSQWDGAQTLIERPSSPYFFSVAGRCSQQKLWHKVRETSYMDAASAVQCLSMSVDVSMCICAGFFVKIHCAYAAIVLPSSRHFLSGEKVSLSDAG